MKKENTILLVLILFIMVSRTGAQQLNGPDAISPNLKDTRSKWEYGAEYFFPDNINSHINTINLDLYFWQKYFRHSTVLVNIGAVASYGNGYIERYQISNTGLVSKRYYCHAAGAGPSLQIQFPFIQIHQFSVEAEANGSFLLYTNRFPYGGYIYNFMFRTGPNFCWTFNTQFAMKLGYRWMHVSNGSGEGLQNPWYNSQGLTLSVVKFIR